MSEILSVAIHAYYPDSGINETEARSLFASSARDRTVTKPASGDTGFRNAYAKINLTIGHRGPMVPVPETTGPL